MFFFYSIFSADVNNHPKQLDSALKEIRETKPSTIKMEPDRNPRDRPFKCMTCSLAFSHKGNLTRHLNIHTGEKRFRCDYCPAVFHRKNNLNSHIKVHTGERPFQCDICPAAFSEKATLYKHQFIHTGEKPYKCSSCPFTSSHRASLFNHQRQHIGETTYYCVLCSSTFNNTRALNIHQRKHSDIEKTFVCESCPSRFTNQSALDIHRRQHAGEPSSNSSSFFNNKISSTTHFQSSFEYEPFTLDSLGKFQQDIHKRILNTDEKPFECDGCSAVFSRRALLISHMKTHTGQEPHQCQICQAAFSIASNLTKHQKTHAYRLETFNRERPIRSYSRSLATSRQNSNSDTEVKLFQGGLDIKHESFETCGKKTFECYFCPLEFDDDTTLVMHTKMIHTGA